MFGAIPKTAWSRRYPSDEQNGCILAMRTLLVRDGNGKIVLVDNGARGTTLLAARSGTATLHDRPKQRIAAPVTVGVRQSLLVRSALPLRGQYPKFSAPALHHPAALCTQKKDRFIPVNAFALC